MRVAWTGLLLLGGAMCNEDPPGKAGDTGVTTPTTTTVVTPNGLDCAEVLILPDPGLAGLPECVVEELKCGDVIDGNNLDGTTMYDRAYWVEAQELDKLASEPNDVLDGPERVYAIYGQPPDSEITVTVTSCVQLWPSFILHGDISGDWCDVPSPNNQSGHFTGEWQNKSTTLLNRAAGTYNWEILIDSWKGQTGNYRIEVDCF